MAYAVAAAVVVLDQASKAWILGPFDLPERGVVEVLPVFRLSMVWNPGVSFGLLAAKGDLGRWLLVAFAAAVVVALAVWARRSVRLVSALAVGLVMGGAIGNNILDRVRFGAVADFLDFSGLGFKWVFNVADSAITVGVILLLIEMALGVRAAESGARS
ncbi:MAG: signal peptidase II [Caulobacteraceae bacterium]|nr:signal peptidase II [Caulobacteraceae bacterium]